MFRNVLLALLARAPAHGYELKQAVDDAFGRVWPPLNIGQVYTTLARLERDGLIRSDHVPQDHKPDKRVYALTDRGRTVLQAWLAQPSTERRLKDEFVVKLILAPSVGNGDDPLVLIDRQRRDYLRTLRDLHELGERLDAAGDAAGSLLLEGAILHLQADLAWLDLCEARLAQGDIS